MIIYIITNLVTDKKYVGQTMQKDPKSRWYDHQRDAFKNNKKYPLYNSMRKHGKENFTWEIVDHASSMQELNELESAWENKLLNEGVELYNLRETGGNKGSHSEISIKKMSESQKKAHARRRANGGDGGWTRSDGGPMKGKVHPKKGKPGKKWDEESKEKHKIKMQEIHSRPEYKEKNAKRLREQGKKYTGMTWKLVDGKRVWIEK